MAVLGLLSHGAIVGNHFIWDDATLIVTHPQIGHFSFVGKIFERDYGREFGGYQPTGYYRPFFVLLVWLQRQVFGLHRFGYRAVSLATLVLTAWVAALLLFRFSRRRGAAFLAGALLACHPFLTESVAFVASWPDLFLGLVLGAGLWLALRSLKEERNRRRMALQAMFALCVFLAALTKESAYFASAGLMLGLLAVGRRKRRRAIGCGVAWAVGLGLAFGLRSQAALGGPKGMNEAAVLLGPFSGSGAASSLWALVTSAELWVVPRVCAYFHFNPAMRPNGALSVWTALGQPALFLLAAGFVVLMGGLVVRRRPLIAALLGWFVLGSYPLLLSVANGMAFSERYVAVVPLAILTGLALVRWVRPLAKFPAVERASRRSWIGFLAWTVAGICVVFSFLGSLKPFNARSFWTSVEQEDPRVFQGHLGLSTVYFDDGHLDAMRREATIAIRQNPDSPLTRRLATNLGIAAISENKPQEALTWYDWTLETMPDYPEALKGRAVALHLLGRDPEARETIEKACAVSPDTASLEYVAARIYAQSLDVAPENAIPRIRRAAVVAAQVPTAWTTLDGLKNYRKTLAREKPAQTESGNATPGNGTGTAPRGSATTAKPESASP